MRIAFSHILRPTRRATLISGAALAAASLALAGAAWAALPVSGAHYKGKTVQSAAETGQQNEVRFRVSGNGEHLHFVGITNVVGDHCVDTLSDAAHANQGIGHRAPDIRINRKSGHFHGEVNLNSGGTTLTTTIGGDFVGQNKAEGRIKEVEPPNAFLPQGCSVDVVFHVSR